MFDRHEIDEPVELAYYNSEWAKWFLEESESLKRLLGDDFKTIEHFGSTSIPGIYAKPIVDILVGIDPVPLNEKRRQSLVNDGYKYFGEAGVTGRFYFSKRGVRNFNLAVVHWNGPLWRRNIVFRDYLRTHPRDARLYEKKKKAIVKEGSFHLFDYSDRKKPIISKLMKRAEDWEKQRDSL